MGSSKPKVYQLPQQQTQQQTNTFAPFSIANTPEAQNFLNTPLDFGDPVNVDPGVGRRTDLAEQEVENRYNSGLNFGVPSFIRQANQAKELRDIRGQGAYEAAQANYANQQANNALRAQKTAAELDRRRILLPQILQTGGTGSSTGYTSTLGQPQPGFLQSLALSAVGGLSNGVRFGAGG